MDKKYFTLGLFVVVSIGLLVALAFEIGAFSSRAVDRYTVEINDAAGVVPGNAIKSAGVEIGRVGSVGLSDDGKRARLHLHVWRGTPIYDDARISIQPISLLGEKFVNVEQHRSKTAQVLDPGSELPEGQPSVDVSNLFDLARGVVYSEEELYPEVVELTTRLNRLVAAIESSDDEEMRERMKDLGTRVNSLLDNLNSLTEVGGKILEENRDDVSKLVTAGRTILEDQRIDKIIGRTDNLLRTLNARAPALLDSAERVLGKTDRLLASIEPGKVKSIVNDGQAVMANVKQMTEDLKPVTRRLDPLTRDLKVITGRASKITGKVIREFTQKEGMKIFLGSPKGDLKRKLQRMGVME